MSGGRSAFIPVDAPEVSGEVEPAEFGDDIAGNGGKPVP